MRGWGHNRRKIQNVKSTGKSGRGNQREWPILIDSTVVSTAGYRAFVPFVLITPNHELWLKNYQQLGSMLYCTQILQYVPVLSTVILWFLVILSHYLFIFYFAFILGWHTWWPSNKAIIIGKGLVKDTWFLIFGAFRLLLFFIFAKSCPLPWFDSFAVVILLPVLQ